MSRAQSSSPASPSAKCWSGSPPARRAPPPQTPRSCSVRCATSHSCISASPCRPSKVWRSPCPRARRWARTSRATSPSSRPGRSTTACSRSTSAPRPRSWLPPDASSSRPNLTSGCDEERVMAEGPFFPRTQLVGIFLYEDFEPLDVWGFAEAFTIARCLGTGYSDAQAVHFKGVFIDKEGKPVPSLNGPQSMPDLDIAQATKESFDVLMVPGGYGTWPLIDDTEVLAWLAEMDSKVGIMASVCTGAAMYAKLGLLDGKPAASNPAAFGWVSSVGPLVLCNSVARWVDAGHYVTSAGVSAGTDMAFC